MSNPLPISILINSLVQIQNEWKITNSAIMIGFIVIIKRQEEILLDSRVTGVLELQINEDERKGVPDFEKILTFHSCPR